MISGIRWVAELIEIAGGIDVFFRSVPMQEREGPHRLRCRRDCRRSRHHRGLLVRQENSSRTRWPHALDSPASRQYAAASCTRSSLPCNRARRRSPVAGRWERLYPTYPCAQHVDGLAEGVPPTGPFAWHCTSPLLPLYTTIRRSERSLRLRLRQVLVRVDLVEVHRLLEQVDVDERLLQQFPPGAAGMSNTVLLRVRAVEQAEHRRQLYLLYLLSSVGCAFTVSANDSSGFALA